MAFAFGASRWGPWGLAVWGTWCHLHLWRAAGSLGIQLSGICGVICIWGGPPRSLGAPTVADTSRHLHLGRAAAEPCCIWGRPLRNPGCPAVGAILYYSHLRRTLAEPWGSNCQEYAVSFICIWIGKARRPLRPGEGGGGEEEI